MSLILTRSPFFISKGNLDNASLGLNIGYVDSSGVQIVLQTYTFAYRGIQRIDISPFIRDYLEDYEIVTATTYLNGDISEVAQTEVVTNYLAVDGYSYYEEGYNVDKCDELEDNLFYAGSSDLIYRYSSVGLSLPFVHCKLTSPYDVTVSYYEGDNVFYTQNVDFTNNNETSVKVQYITDYVSYNLGDGNSNDIEDGNSNILSVVSEISEDSRAYVTKVVIDDGGGNEKELTVVTIDKCKYEPYKIVFRNKLGVYEDMWFFRKSMKSLSVNKENYRPNIVESFASGSFKHQKEDFNVNGNETIMLNTGFIPESFNESIKQLMLSESVFLDYEDVRRPVNIIDTELQYKQHVNDKLINYAINFSFSNDVINNIG